MADRIEEFRTKISRMNAYIATLNHIIEKLSELRGDESPEQKQKLYEKLFSAGQCFERIRGKLLEYELNLGDVHKKTHNTMMSLLDFLIEELKSKRNDFLDELRGSWRVNSQPFDPVFIYLDKVKSLMVESEMLKVELEEFQSMVHERSLDVNENPDGSTKCEPEFSSLTMADYIKIKVSSVESNVRSVSDLLGKVNLCLEDIKIFKKAIEGLQSTHDDKVVPQVVRELGELMIKLFESKFKLKRQAWICYRTIQEVTKTAVCLFDSSKWGLDELKKEAHDVLDGNLINPINREALIEELGSIDGEALDIFKKLNELAGSSQN